MGATIKSVHIENFRSIRLLDAELDQISVFTGKNDSGKSNIFRALNLFFNDETNPSVEFDFAEDYNFFAPQRARRAPEIIVRLEISLPETYHRTNGQVISWTKKWREDGLWEDRYHGLRKLRNRRGDYWESVEIPDKSNVHSLLRKIDFEYVPAIKDDNYFDDLRGRIYGIISEVAARTFHESSAAFEQSIGEHLDGLTTNITASLGFSTRLALPRDLSHIFERLDFLSGERSVSLNNRGDGIKARHIPLILRFMAERKAELQRRGGSPVSSIWAYEEPENNLELASAVQLADELHRIASDRVAQIILTTHSPAFYDLGQREDDVRLNFVARSSDEDGTVTKPDNSGIDESLGTLAMLSSRVAGIVEAVRNQEAAKAEAARLAEENCPRIFVEGESDKVVLERALTLFYPQLADNVRFETKAAGGGHAYVIDMLSGWRSHHKHHQERPKAAGIVDGDATGQSQMFNSQPDNIKSAKCFVYPNTLPIRSAKAAGFRVSSTLETLYPKTVWDDAMERGRLETRDRSKVYPTALINRILNGEAGPDDGLNPDWAIFVTHDFGSDVKIATARRLAMAADDVCRNSFGELQAILRGPLVYLGLLRLDD